jgi:hypothetical protein
VSTQKFTGSGQLVKRLTEQLRTQKRPPSDPEGAAIAILKARGHMDDKGNLTEAGKARDGMTAAQRAVDRQSKYTGQPARAFKYDPKTNLARKK